MSDNIPQELKYTKSHEWARVEGDVVIVGITDYAVEQMNREIINVDLPKVGRNLNQEESFAVIDSVKAAFDIYAPVSGLVAEINDALVAKPDLVGQSPYGEGWLIKIKPINLNADIAKLLTADRYEQSIEH